VLAEAQAKGFAEADPTEDVGGLTRAPAGHSDAAGAACGGGPGGDCAPAHHFGFCVTSAMRGTGLHHPASGAGRAGLGQVAATVGRCWWICIRRWHGRGNGNMVIITGHYGGTWCFQGAARRTSDSGSRGQRSAGAGARVEKSGDSIGSGGREREFEVPHYIRFLVADRPGIVSEITGALARRALTFAPSCRSRASAGRAAVCSDVEPCKASALQRALATMSSMDCLLVEPLDLQMLE